MFAQSEDIDFSVALVPVSSDALEYGGSVV